MTIIRNAKQFNMDTFQGAINIVTDPQIYYSAVLEKWKEVKEYFPLLRLVIWPTSKPHTAFIQGLLLSKEHIEDLHLDEEQYENYGLPIIALIPEDFKSKGLEVYDCCHRINWDEIPDDIKHCNGEIGDVKKICTHKQQYVNESNCFFNIIKSAYSLYLEYRRYDVCGKFELKCLPHGG